jgi:hypothetical protein
MNSTEISYAKLHTSIFIVGFGTIPDTLTADPNGGKMKKMKMKTDETGTFLLVEVEGRTIIVPINNVAYMVAQKPSLKPVVNDVPRT